MKYDLKYLNSIPILEIANKLGVIVKKNKAICFNGHDNKTPSLSFTPSKNLWHCFGCNAGGGNINLVMNCLDLDFKNACKWIIDSFNLNSRYPSDKRSINNKIELNRNEDSIHNTVNLPIQPNHDIYHWLIQSCSLSKKGSQYLINKRKYTEDTIKYFNIVDIEFPKDIFIRAVNSYGREKLINCGLAKIDDEEKVKFIWWDHVILFPFYDKDDYITYIQGRRIGNDNPKYLNLNGIKTNIFNLKVLNILNGGEIIFICEGVTDTMHLHQLGLNAVGILGANNFKEEWAHHFLKYEIIVMQDSDKAGEAFVKNIESVFHKFGKNIKTIAINNAKDISELVCIELHHD